MFVFLSVSTRGLDTASFILPEKIILKNEIKHRILNTMFSYSEI